MTKPTRKTLKLRAEIGLRRSDTVQEDNLVDHPNRSETDEIDKPDACDEDEEIK